MVVLLLTLPITVVDSFVVDMFTGFNELIGLNFVLQKPSPSTGAIWKELNIGKLKYDDVSAEIADAARGSFQRSDDDEVSWKSASDVLFQEDNDDIIPEPDSKFAEDLQIQEALLASTSSHKTRSTLSSLLKSTEFKEIICKICLENQESWQMFTNSTCSHSFCYTCTRKHATTKIHESKNTITCPELNCKSTLDPNTLRQIIPKETLIKWDEHLCESMILESQKLYCPFADCSVLLINDDISITNIDCPVCRRAFCAVCRVPWHSEFSCKEFGKLKSKRKGKRDDDMAIALAKKKKWKKCPMCRFFVEKSEGCLHITCRCEYEFCYNCGGKWSSSHGGCKSRS
ncbi:unnamed protein product [Lactuca saligna]|uniref:RBR-type E3 ubiquitin transferase n=1 Tax=Lactuca saligna TaxID=75948 RepID=A0AA35V3W4_LACSI|nr:unnamed protein product [Lactuca saligna]